MAGIDIEPTEVATAIPYDAERQKFLLLKRSFDAEIHPGTWNFPGGRIRKTDASNSISAGNADGHIEDEDPENAALRELEEETGLSGELIRSGEPFTLDTEDGKFKIYPFLILVEGEPELNSEHRDHSWIESRELGDFDTVDDLEQDLRKVGVLDE